MADLLSLGRPGTPPHPWLGMTTQEVHGRLIIVRVSEDGPAQRAGLARGTVITSIAGQPVSDLAGFYRQLWAQGPAGVEVALTVSQDGTERDVRVKTIDRYRYLKLDQTY
jgi:S1-C subfamily serine protease